MTIYNDILEVSKKQQKLLAVLIDPDKMQLPAIAAFIEKVNQSIATHIFIGGSTVEEGVTQSLIAEIKKHTTLPVVIFPGSSSQISRKADALLFLSLVSGRNPEYLIGEHVKSVSILRNLALEIIPTAYVLIDSGVETAVQRVTQTEPLKQTNISHIVDTAKAGELLGMKLVYLEAGSGAKHEVSAEIIKQVKADITIPLIVGGGIRSIIQLKTAYKNGADMVVIGTAFEKDDSFFKDLKEVEI